MSDTDRPEEITVRNDRALKKLSRAIANSQGHFSLILVRCNYNILTEQIVRRLQAMCPVQLRELYLSESVETLYTTLEEELGAERPQALLVFGLESVAAIESILTSTNQVREEFRKQFPFPLVLWVNDNILQKLTRFAPDFKSWAAIPIKFEMVAGDLLDGLQQTLDSILDALLDVGAGKFIESASISLSPGSLSLAELEPALRDLQQRHQPLEPDLEANLQFAIAREADAAGDKQKARECYERSWQLWQPVINSSSPPSPTHINHYGCLLFYLGLWWRQYATLNRAEYQPACQQAKAYYQPCLEAFQQSQRPDLEQNFINALEEVLTRLEGWDELKVVADRAIQLHQTHRDFLRLGYGYGVLAEVALHHCRWSEARHYAQLALQHNEEPLDSTIDWSWNRKHNRSYYRFLLARSQQHLNEIPKAIANLEAAKTNSSPAYDPPLYIRILESLRSLKFDRAEYLEAFEIKQEKQSIEQQHGLRAFVGAGRLQVRRQVDNAGFAPSEQHPDINAEIAASGRLQDVERLIERMGRTDCKLTVIHGQSGVGKSSLVQAGLIPALKQIAVEARDVLPVLLQVYSNWAKNLGASFTQSYEEVCGLSLPILLDSMEIFLDELRKASDRNLLTVLIFDQFEEFFFAYKDPRQRKPFFTFLSECLDLPYVKVILSLREDYLHYLLECNRLTDLDVINNNILDKNILYYLGNLKPQDAKSVIETLTQNSQFYLDVDLIEALVEDLSGEIAEVRPIELQVVGSQLQTENITTLAQFEERGSKEALVEHFLEEIVKDCGPNNENFVKIILYLLTDENNTRPLKTRTELDNELDLDAERLDSILKILVRSGLVFKIPGFPKERYQLVHDYLVPFIRQKQSATLVAELEKEREQRKLTEAQLNKVLTKQLKASLRAKLTFFGFVCVAIITGINLYIFTLVTESSSSNNIDRLVSAIRAGKALKQIPVAIPGLRLKVAAELNTAIHRLDELNRLEGHEAGVTKVIFSPNGKLLASASEDNVVKIWNLEGENIEIPTEHSEKITGINFSPDGKMIASASEDKTIKVWTVNGEFLWTIYLPSAVPSVAFSPDGKKIAAPFKNNIQIRDISNQQTIAKIRGHEGEITSVAFSNNGNILAASDRNDTVKLWSLDGQCLQSIENHGTVDIRFSNDDKMLIVVSQDRSVKYYDINGNLINNVEYQEGTTQSVTLAQLSPNRKILALIDRHNAGQINLRTQEGNHIPGLYWHRDRINDLSFSPNSKILASASQDKTIRLWNLDAKSSWVNLDNPVNKIQFNPDGKTIAAARSDSTVQLLDRQGKVRQTLAADGSILSFNPRNKTLVTGSAEDIVKIHSLDDPPIVLKGHPNGIAEMSVSPDGKRCVSVGRDGSLKFWNSDGQLIRTQAKLGDKIANLQFSPDSQRVTLIANDNLIYLYTKEGEEIAVLKGHISRTKTVNFSPDSQQFLTTGDDNLIHLYAKNGKKIGTLRSHQNQVLNAIFSPDSTMIASTSKNANGRSVIKLWWRDGRLMRILNGYEIERIHFSSDNAIIAALNYDNTVQLWSTEGRALATLHHNRKVTDLSFSPDGNICASASADNIVRLWNKDGTLIQSLRDHRDKVNQVVFSPNGKTFASVSNDGMVKLWRQDGTSIRTLQPASKIGNSQNAYRKDRIEFSEDGQVIVLIRKLSQQEESSSIIKFWNSEGREIKTIQGQESWDLENVFFSTGGKNVTLVEKVKSLKSWSLDKSSEITFSGHKGTVNSVSFSHDGKVLASTSDDQTVKLWNRKGKLLQTLQHKDKVNSVSFSLDGKVLASGSNDRTVKLWNRKGKLLQTLQHKDKVNIVSFSLNGKVLASASDDQTVKLWNREGQLLHTLKHSSAVKKVRFSRNNKTIASVTEDNTVRVWKTDNRKELRKIENSNILDFSLDSSLLAVEHKVTILNGVWVKDISLPISQPTQFSPDGKMLVVGENHGVSIFHFELDKLLEEGCGLARNYLANTQINKKERRLCDGI